MVSNKTKESRKAVLKLKKLSSTDRESLFERLQSDGKADVYHYSTMMGLSSNSTQAEELFASMRAAGIQPNIVTYNTILSKLMNDGRLHRAEKIFEELAATNRPCPDQRTYCILINGFSKFGRHSRAKQLYFRLKELPDLDSASYHTALSMFCRSGNYVEAEKLLLDMQGCSVKPTATSFTILISSYGKIGRPEDSLRLFSYAEAHGIEIDIPLHNALIQALAINGKISEAEGLAKNRLLTSLADGGKAPEKNLEIGSTPAKVAVDFSGSASNAQLLALNLALTHMPKMTTQGHPCPAEGGESDRKVEHVDVATVTALLNAYGRNQRVDDARELFECLGRLNIRPGVETYNALISCFAANGQLELGEHYYVELLESGLEPDVHTMRALIDGSEAGGDSLGAMTWLCEARRRGVPPFSSYLAWEPGDAGKRVLTIDLHRMSALSSIVAVHYVLSSRRLDPRETELVIITGKGLHSPGGAVVGPVVARFLEEEGFRFTHADGNTGRLVLRPVPGGAATVGLCTVLMALMWATGMLAASASSNETALVTWKVARALGMVVFDNQARV